MNFKNKTRSALQIIKQKDFQIFEEQFLYGHREVLLNYSSLSAYNSHYSNYILEAGLQHGWSADSNVWRLRGKDFQFKPRYVWNKRHETGQNKMQNNVAIGAPWLYLVKNSLNQIKAKVKENKDSALIFPSHSVISHPKNIKAQVEHFNLIVKNYRNKSVCLYWVDFVNPKVRYEFEKYDYKILCAGYGNPRGIYPYMNECGRASYLLRLLEIFERFDTIITDEIQSGVFYALSIGLKLIYAPDLIANQHVSFEKSLVDNNLPSFYDSSQEWVNFVAPEILTSSNHPRTFQALALDELGYESILSVDQVKNLPWKPSDIPSEIFKDFQNDYSEYI